MTRTGTFFLSLGLSPGDALTNRFPDDKSCGAEARRITSSPIPFKGMISLDIEPKQ